MRSRRKQSAGDLRKQKLRVWLQLLKVCRMIEGEVRERFRTRFDTTLPRFDVMSALDRNPKGLTMSQLSRALKVSNGNTTAIVDRLVTDGQVVRVTIDEDRRASLTRLTPKGQREFAAMAEEHENWIDEIIDSANMAGNENLPVLLRSLVRERNAEP